MELIGVLGFVVISIITYNREERINSFFSNHKTIDWVIPFFVCFMISFLFSINLCLSPFNALEPYDPLQLLTYTNLDTLTINITFYLRIKLVKSML